MDDFGKIVNPLLVEGQIHGASAAPAAVVNALMDALAPRGVAHIDMLATPLAVWQALQDARKSSA